MNLYDTRVHIKYLVPQISILVQFDGLVKFLVFLGVGTEIGLLDRSSLSMISLPLLKLTI